MPGEPGLDYPVLAAPDPAAAFSCRDRVSGGYYADPAQRCQVFHVCLDPGRDTRASFLCPNGTVFAQDKFVCDWWFNVDCDAAPGLYSAVGAAFGGGPGGAQCPAAEAAGECGEGAAEDSCWSPGQPDVDCPDSGLCWYR